MSDPQPVNQDLLKLFRLFRRHAGIIALAIMLGLLASILYTSLFVPVEYSADVLLIVWQNKEAGRTEAVTASDLDLYSELIRDYQALVKSRLVTRLVADELQMTPAEYEALPRKITVDTMEDTRQITISVVDEDPQAAAVIANTIAKYFSESVVAKMGAADVQVIDPAVVPEKPVSRGALAKLVIGSFVGLLLGVGAVLLLTSLDSRVRTSADVESLTGYTLLGFIHSYERTSVTGKGALTPGRDRHSPAVWNADLVAHHNPLSPVSESFKTIRTGIEHAVPERRYRSLMVTSTQQDEGKSVTMANLAITYAHLGRNVLMVEADLHSPVLHDYFGITDHGGLTSVLTGAGHFSDFVQPTGLEGLSILTSGPIPLNSADLLDSQTMTDLIGELVKRYDLVLIECPPVGLLADASVVATKVDCTLFVVRAGIANRYYLKRATSLLEQLHARVIGYVMNGIDRSSDDYLYAGGRFLRLQQRLSLRPNETRGLMKAAPLFRQPARPTDRDASFRPYASYAMDLDTGRRRERDREWKG